MQERLLAKITQTRWFFLIVFVVALGFGAFTVYSTHTAHVNKQRLHGLRTVAFPVLERTDANQLRLERIRDIVLHSIAEKESGLLSNAEKELQQSLRAFQEIQDLNPELSADVQLLSQHFIDYFQLAESIFQKLSGVALKSQKEELNLKEVLSTLRELEFQMRSFRKARYHEYTTSLQTAGDVADQVLAIGLVVGNSMLVLLVILSWSIHRNSQVLRSIAEYSDQLEQKVEERTAQLKAAQEEAETANQAKSVFLATISHELRTPMTSLMGFAKLGIREIEQKSNTPKHIHNYFEEIVNSCHQLLALINDLLDLEKMKAGQMDYNMIEYDLLQLIDRAVMNLEPLIQQKSLQVNTTYDGPLPLVKMDPQRILQVLQNLFANAIKFTPENTQITVVAKENLQQMIEVSIEDQGPGIMETERSEVFERFTQGKQQRHARVGSGLGLTICKDIIQTHQGEIWVAPPVEHGAVIKFTLPAVS